MEYFGDTVINDNIINIKMKLPVVIHSMYVDENIEYCMFLVKMYLKQHFYIEIINYNINDDYLTILLKQTQIMYHTEFYKEINKLQIPNL